MVERLRSLLADRGVTLAADGAPADEPNELILNIVEIPADVAADADDNFVDRVCTCVTPSFEGLRASMSLLRPAGGCVVTLVVGRGNAGGDGLMAAAVRGGIANLTRSVALHAGKSGTGIRVNSLYLASDTALEAAADAIGWLSGPEAGFVTGVELVIDRDARS
jgi:hypothetical protein